MESSGLLEMTRVAMCVCVYVEIESMNFAASGSSEKALPFLTLLKVNWLSSIFPPLIKVTISLWVCISQKFRLPLLILLHLPLFPINYQVLFISLYRKFLIYVYFSPSQLPESKHTPLTQVIGGEYQQFSLSILFTTHQLQRYFYIFNLIISSLLKPLQFTFLLFSGLSSESLLRQH